MADHVEQTQETTKNEGVTRAAFLNILAGAGVFAAGGFVGKTFFGDNGSGAPTTTDTGTDTPATPETPAGDAPAPTDTTLPAEELVEAWDRTEAGEELVQMGQFSSETGSSDDEELTEDAFEDYWCTREDEDGTVMNIFGLLFRPEGEGPFPTVICSHGITGMCFNFFTYAQFLQKNGFLVYAFDFCGGNYEDNAQSDGEFIDMSIMTETADLKSVIEAVKEIDGVDTDRLYLMGHSQGGLVTSLVAGDVAEEIAGIILIAPGFELVDMVRSKFPNRADIPDMFDMFGTFKVGKTYGVSLWDLNWQPVIARFTKPVLILHGTKDNVIDYTYSVTASENYEDVQLVLFPNATHWLYDADFNRSCEIILEFLNRA